MKKYFESMFYPAVEFPGRVQAILMIEGKKFRQEEFIGPSEAYYVLETTQPKKTCHKCAEIGYHSNYFDLAWIARCPVHNSTLLSRCPMCHKKWPSFHELRTRNCSCCGIGVKINKIIEKYQPQTDGYLTMQNYLQLIKKHKKLNNKFVTFNATNLFEQLNEVNALSAYTILALDSFNLIDTKALEICKSVINADFSPSHHRYRCKKLPGEEVSKYLYSYRFYDKELFDVNYDEAFRAQLSNINYKTLIKTLDVLSRSDLYTEHLPNFQCEDNYCIQCGICIDLMRILFPDPTEKMESNGYTKKFIQHKVPELVTHIAYCPKEYENEIDMKHIRDYNKERASELLCDEKILVFEIPKEFTLKLYEIDLWILVNKMLSGLIDERFNQQKTLFEEHIHYHNNYGNMQLGTLYMHHKKSSYYIDISYPANLLTESVINSTNYRKMLAPR